MRARSSGRFLAARLSVAAMKVSLLAATTVGLITGITAGMAASEPEARLQRTVLAVGLREPIALDVASDGRVVLAERRGRIAVWDPQSLRLETVGSLTVFSGPEDGLLGLALHPGFVTNGWVFCYHGTPGVLENRLSRFTLQHGPGGGVLDLASQRILLRVPTRIPKPNHSGGGLAFDAAGCLYLGTGDYTYADRSEGFAPLDQRPGQELNDSERTAANTADWRGKILRIHPEADGTYTIPLGNLFPAGNPKALPEIYAMGCRNPFRLSIDHPTGRLFWGDVGPDATQPDPARGPSGFDEFHVTRTAGNFGWPYFIADNRPYRRFDFATRVSGEPWNPEKPINESAFNTGLSDLPPARPAFLWYPPGPSARWPEVGSGPRSAMAGPTYHFSAGLKSPVKLPAEWDGATFLMDWERGWILGAWLDAEDRITRLKPLLPGQKFRRPICLQLGPDGALYLIEWGSRWSDNTDAALVRVSASAE